MASLDDWHLVQRQERHGDRRPTRPFSDSGWSKLLSAAGMGVQNVLDLVVHVGSFQNYDPFWGTLNNRCRIIKGTLILTTTHVSQALAFRTVGLRGQGMEFVFADVLS